MTQELIKTEVSDLQLKVEQTLGVLTHNAKVIKEAMLQKIAYYDNIVYDENNIDIAKKDRAFLNNLSKSMNSERIKIEKEFMRHFAEFKSEVKETTDLIDKRSSNIDNVVKSFEEIEKQKKYDLILTYFLEKQFILVEFEKIYKPEWLNKTYKLQDAKLDIDYKINAILEDIDYIENCSLDIEDRDWIKADYLKTLDRKLSFENHKTFSENQYLLRVAETEEAKQLNARNDEPTVVHPQSEILTRIFKVETTRENLIALSDFMNERGIVFEKIENGGR